MPAIRDISCLLWSTGQIEISHNAETLESVSAGGVVGEMPVVEDEGTRSADGIAASFYTLVPIHSQRFRGFFQRYSDSALEVMRSQARRLREINGRFAFY